MQLDAKYEYFFGIKLVSSKLKMISGITPSSEDSTEEAIQCMKVFRRRMQMCQRIRLIIFNGLGFYIKYEEI